MIDTNKQYDTVVAQCSSLFFKKSIDYGTAWRVLRPISVVDQIFIKALRIATVQNKKKQMVEDDVFDEFIGIVNYGIIGLIQLQINNAEVEELEITVVEKLYANTIEFAKNTMLQKNHDYGEAWRSMSHESFVDLILMKLQRIKQILNNNGKTLVSEGIDANYVDIINYAIFALILR
jgi:Nucleotide modification associated domain 1